MFYLAVTRQQEFYSPDFIILEDDDDDDMDCKQNGGSKRLNPFQQQLDSQIMRPFNDPLNSIKNPSSAQSIHSPQKTCMQNQPCQCNQLVPPKASNMFFNYASSVVDSMPSKYALEAQKEINDVLMKYQVASLNEDRSTLIDVEEEEQTISDY